MKINPTLIQYVIDIVKFRGRELKEEMIINDDLEKNLNEYLEEWKVETTLKAATMKTQQKKLEERERIKRIRKKLIKNKVKPSGRNIAREMNILGFKMSHTKATYILKDMDRTKKIFKEVYKTKKDTTRRLCKRVHKNKFNRFKK